MDGVVADFHNGVLKYDSKAFSFDKDTNTAAVNAVCESNPKIFSELEPIDGSIDAAKKLFDLYDVYFLSTPMWNVPQSFMCKRLWLEKHFGSSVEKRLILTHRKDFNIGEFIVDDTTWNGVDKFKGYHIHYGTEEFPNWIVTYNFLRKVAKQPFIDINRKMFTAKEIRTKLRSLSPGLTSDKLTNPFLYRDIEKWYKELKPF